MSYEGNCCTKITQFSYLKDVNNNDTFDFSDIPVGKTVTGITMIVIEYDLLTTILDGEGNILSDIPSGTTLSWNVSDYGELIIPSLSVGVSGRVIVNYTAK